MTDVVDLIMQDHRELQRMFEELQSELSKRKALAPVMSTLLFAPQPGPRSPRSTPAPGQRVARRTSSTVRRSTSWPTSWPSGSRASIPSRTSSARSWRSWSTR